MRAARGHVQPNLSFSLTVDVDTVQVRGPTTLLLDPPCFLCEKLDEWRAQNLCCAHSCRVLHHHDSLVALRKHLQPLEALIWHATHIW